MTNEMIIQIAQGKLKSLNPLSCRLFGKNEMKQAQIKMLSCLTHRIGVVRKDN